MVYFLSCLPPMLVSMNMLSYVFNSAVPKHRCYIDGCDNASSTYAEAYNNFTIPYENGKLGACSQFDFVSPSNDSCQPSSFETTGSHQCDRWVYDRSVYHSTVVTEWDLTCDKKEQAPLSGMVWMAGVIAGAAFFGYASDRFGRHPTVMSSILLMAVTSFIVPFLPNYPSFLVLRFFQAASTSGVYQTLFVLGLELVENSKRVFCGIGLNFAFALGEIFLGIVAYCFRDWRTLQLALAVPSAFFFIYYWIIPESVRWLISQERYADAVKLIKKIAVINKTTVPSEYMEQDVVMKSSSSVNSEDMAPKEQVSVLELFRRRKLRWRTINIFLNWFMNTLGYYGISMNSTNLGGNEYLNFILTSVVELPAYVFCILILDRLGRKIPLAMCMILGGISCISVIFVPDKEEFHWIQLTLSLIGKFGCSAAFSIIYVFSAELFPTVLRNNGIGLSSFFAHIGGMIAPYIAYLAVYGRAVPLLISGTSLVISGLMAFCLPETLNQRLPETVEDAELFGSNFYNELVTPKTPLNENEALLQSQQQYSD